MNAKWREYRQFFETNPMEVRTAKEKQRLLTTRMAAFTEEKRQKQEAIKKELAEFWNSKFARLDQSVTETSFGPYHFLSGHNPAGTPAS